MHLSKLMEEFMWLMSVSRINVTKIYVFLSDVTAKVRKCDSYCVSKFLTF